MRVTAEYIRRLIAKAEGGDDRAHDNLERVDEDLREDDLRVREGMGMSRYRAAIDADAKALLDKYLSTH